MANAVFPGFERADSRSALRRRVSLLLKLFISIGMLAYVISTASLREVFHALAATSLLPIACAALLNPVGMVLVSLRWQGLLASHGVRIPLSKLIQSCIVASFFRQFLPSTIGGDLIRAYDSWRFGASKSLAVSTLAVDRAFGLIVLLIFALVALTLFPTLNAEFPSLVYWLLGGLGLMMGVTAILFGPTTKAMQYAVRLSGGLPRPLLGVARKVLAAASMFQGKHDVIVTSLLLSIAFQLNVIAFYYLIGRSLGFDVLLQAYFIIVPVAVFVMMAPLSINAIGIREGIFVLLFALFDIETARAIAFAWLEYAVFLAQGLIGGLFFAFRRYK